MDTDNKEFLVEKLKVGYGLKLVIKK